MSDNRVYIYDTTLRDGAQTSGVKFTVADKITIAQELDDLGVDYVEGGWPGANPTDDSFFEKLPELTNARFSTFGMTRRAGKAIEDDKGFIALTQTDAKVVTIVGKTWDFHVDVALQIERSENVKIIAECIEYAKNQAGVEEVVFDAEHFFDGYKANPEYALECLKAAYGAGARWVVLCDTNGGVLPYEVFNIVSEVSKHVPSSHIGIHCHNDTDNAVASSLAAVRAGARHVQGTINGLGERCGNANLTSMIPNIMLKLGLETGISDENLKKLRHVSRVLDERLNRAPDISAPYVGKAAFAHKGGLHVSAVEKDPKSYEHVEPELVGNQRHLLISDQAGKSNIMARFRELGIEIDSSDPKVSEILTKVKEHEHMGLSYDGAEASFELLARRLFEDVPEYFRIDAFRVIVERRYNIKGELVNVSEGSVRAYVQDKDYFEVAEGDGPVDALSKALKKVLVSTYPQLEDLLLVDYKVRILASEKGTAAVPRVVIESADKDGKRWSTVGVSHDIIDASFDALADSINYKLFRDGVKV
ncbi:MAG: citramalate synthase [Alphaproteobacteria bacterium]|nr:citramalate synthase [Alphaproteobacteria bacterium]